MQGKVGPCCWSVRISVRSREGRIRTITYESVRTMGRRGLSESKLSTEKNPGLILGAHTLEARDKSELHANALQSQVKGAYHLI